MKNLQIGSILVWLALLVVEFSFVLRGYVVLYAYWNLSVMLYVLIGGITFAWFYSRQKYVAVMMLLTVVVLTFLGIVVLFQAPV